MSNNYPKDISYEEFLRMMEEKVQEILGQEYSVELVNQIRNNGIVRDGLIISCSNCNISPTIYLNDYYESFLYKESETDIIHEILHRYKEAILHHNHWQNELVYDTSSLQNMICYRLINLKKNKILLENMPHIPYLDLAIVYCCIFDSTEEDMSSIRITNDLMEYLGLDEKEIHKLAVKNTIHLLPPVLSSLYRMIGSEDSMTTNSANLINSTTSIDSSNKISLSDSSMLSPMYVLTNDKGINGATCMLYPNLLKDFSKTLCSDLYIIPSSIHEVIIIPKTVEYKKEQLEKMLREINITEVPIEDVLSDKVYTYSLEEDAIYL